MARLNTIANLDSPTCFSSSLSRVTRLRPNVTPPSPTPSDSSDKENIYENPREDMSTDHAAKRRRTEVHTDQAIRQPPNPHPSTNPDLRYYDPNQDIEERRQVRKGLRELNKEAQDLRQEWLAPQSTGLQDAIVRANELFHTVKQTSDATIDSRLLVTAGDLAYRKTQHIVLGDGAQGVDVDEFVSNCISFMNRAGTDGDENRVTATLRRRRRATQANDSDDEENGPDAGDALNWEWLGAQACFPSNSRPPVPGFLLGPLSVQKRVRTQRARRERLQGQGHVEAVRPDELKAADLQQAENSNLTAICKSIFQHFVNVQQRGMRKVEEEASDDITETELQALFDKHNVAENEGVPLFRFALHPTSFGQTVENLFYVSFLIRDGMIGIGKDDSGMPTLHNSYEDGEKQQSGKRSSRTRGVKHQAVFSLDFETWEELVKVFQIREPVIPDRTKDQASTRIGATGWYA